MTTSLVKRARKRRFYPTHAQEQTLLRTMGCTRLVYNKTLAAKKEAWENEKRSIAFGETSTLLTGWKKTPELNFLNEVSSVPLQQGLRHLNTAYKNFFAHGRGYPKFKSRHDHQGIEFTRSGFTYRNGELSLAKMRGPLAIVGFEALPEGLIPSTVTVSRDKAGRWFVSMLLEETITQYPGATLVVGVDLGVKAAAVLSTGQTLHLPKVPKKLEAKLKKAQRELARRQKGSKNRTKSRLKIARIHAHIADKRKDALHKVTTSIVRENQTIAIEDLNVAGMTRSARGTLEKPGKNVAQKAGLNRAILNNSFGEFRRMLTYKSQWHGRTLVVIDRFEPTTQRCSACGEITGPKGKKGLKVRYWTCSACDAGHDRDHNAAKNILAVGMAVSVCGETIGGSTTSG